MKAISRGFSGFVILVSSLFAWSTINSAHCEPFKLQVEQQGYLQGNPIKGQASYPAPRMIQQQPLTGRAQSSVPFNSGVQSRQPLSATVDSASSRIPLSGNLQQRVVLPPVFLGLWHVQGQRTTVEAASPDFQSGAEQAFSIHTDNIWEIAGNPEIGYTMGSNTGVKTQLVIDRVQGNTAFIRYQHPIGNTMAQEAIVMTLIAGGMQFNGLERIAIVKQGQAPRARVTYQLIGRRQR